MSKLLKYLLSGIVLAILTLHLVFPHPHADKLTVAEHLDLHKKSHSLIGTIILAFHETNDENLDNLLFVRINPVEKSDPNTGYSFISVVNTIQTADEQTETKRFNESGTHFITDPLFVKLYGLRAPPLRG